MVYCLHERTARQKKAREGAAALPARPRNGGHIPARAVPRLRRIPLRARHHAVAVLAHRRGDEPLPVLLLRVDGGHPHRGRTVRACRAHRAARAAAVQAGGQMGIPPRRRGAVRAARLRAFVRASVQPRLRFGRARPPRGGGERTDGVRRGGLFRGQAERNLRKDGARRGGERGVSAYLCGDRPPSERAVCLPRQRLFFFAHGAPQSGGAVRSHELSRHHGHLFSLLCGVERQREHPRIRDPFHDGARDGARQRRVAGGGRERRLLRSLRARGGRFSQLQRADARHGAAAQFAARRAVRRAVCPPRPRRKARIRQRERALRSV